MLGDTFDLPLSGGTVTLNLINQDSYSSEYLFRNATNEYRVRIRHSTMAVTALKPYARDRHNLEVVRTTFATDTTPEYEFKFYFVIEHKPNDTSVDVPDAIADKMIASTNALLVALLGWES